MTRKALGRGINALLKELDNDVEALDSPKPTRTLAEIELSLIEPNPFQPRMELSEESLEELAASIRISGVLQPILVRPKGDGYQLVAGERRWRAAKKAGLQTIPATVRPMDDDTALELALAENLIRDSLSPLEIAYAYDRLHKEFHLTHEEIAEHLGVSRASVSNSLRLLSLASKVQKLLADRSLSAGHARALVAVESPADQEALAYAVVKKNLSVRALESLIAQLNGRKAAEKAEKEPAAIDPNLRAAIMELERALGTRVRINGGADRGRIEITYYSPEDLNRIYDWILRK